MNVNFCMESSKSDGNGPLGQTTDLLVLRYISLTLPANYLFKARLAKIS